MTPKAAAKHMVSSCRVPEIAAARRECFAGMLRHLEAWGIRIVGTMSTAVLVEHRGADHCVSVWFLNDNGGEVNMGRVNDPAPDMNAPYTAGGFMLDGATLAYRVRCLMTGESIDWTRGVGDLRLQPADARRAMWGENDAAYPGDEAWSRIVD